MRGRNKSWDSWDENSLYRRDVRQDHGGGPEVMPHKKKSAGKPRKKIDHKHEYVEFYEDTWYGRYLYIKCKQCNASNWKKSRYLMKVRGDR